LKFTKDAWTIPLPARGVKGVNVHLESRRPGGIRIDVEPFPYEGGIEKDAARVRELQEHLTLKTRLIETLRSRKWGNELGATTKGLKSPEVPSTLCAMKFQSGMGAERSIESDSQFMARVIDEAAPVLDRVITDFRAHRGRERSV
jgi:hypothetical protein